MEESGYIRRIGVKKTKVGFQASIYELSWRGYMAILLNFINLDDLLRRTDETSEATLLADILDAISAHCPR